MSEQPQPYSDKGQNVRQLHFSSKRKQCKSCGANRGFAPIIGNEAAGKCFACGKFIPPASPDAAPDPHMTLVKRTTTEYYTVPEDHVASSIDLLRSTPHPFIDTMNRLTRPGYAQAHWKIGMTPDYGIIFWYENARGQVMNGKVVYYEHDGFHRKKDGKPPRFLYKRNDGYGQCLFGEAQLHPSWRNLQGQPSTFSEEIILVESEKTAILLTYEEPGCIWLATGGANGLTREKAWALRGRNVFVAYDNDEAGRTGAVLAGHLLASVNATADVMPDIYLTLLSAENHADLADTVAARKVREYKEAKAKNLIR